MKKSFTKYSALSTALLVGGPKLAKSAIVFTDLDPDNVATSNTSTFTGDHFFMDIDDDGTNDLFFYSSGFSIIGSRLDKVSNSNITRIDFVTSGSDINPLAINTEIGASSTFSTVSDLNLFSEQGDKYVGVEFVLNNNTHYGWVLINISGNSITAKEFAYEDTPNQSINAGDKVTFITNGLTAIPELEIFPNPTTDVLNIKGIVVQNTKIISTHGIEVANGQGNEIDVSNLETGIYHIEAKTSEGTAIRRFIKR